MIASALDNSVGAGVTHSEALARSACGKQLAASGTVQAGVADDGAVLGFERAAGWRHDGDLATGHAFADVVVGIALQVQVQATGVPYAEALAGSTLEAEGDRVGGHALVAVQLGDFARDTGTDGTVAVADVEVELATG